MEHSTSWRVRELERARFSVNMRRCADFLVVYCDSKIHLGVCVLLYDHSFFYGYGAQFIYLLRESCVFLCV